MPHRIIHFDYEDAPYGQKTKLLLTAADIQFERCNQPGLLPRPDLEQLGITYRRIPILAVGKDVYCDSSRIFDLVVNSLAPGRVPVSTADKAWESYGAESFANLLTLFHLGEIPPAVLRDRDTVFPLGKRPDFSTLRPSGLSEFRSRCSYIEDGVLANETSQNIYRRKLSVADIHWIWAFRWGLTGVNGCGVKDEGFGEDVFPKLWKLLDSLPEAKSPTITSQETIAAITEGDYYAQDLSIVPGDPLGLSAGTMVAVESME